MISTPRTPCWGVDPWVCPGVRLRGGGSGRAQRGRHVQRLPHLPQRPGHQPGAQGFNFDFHTAYLITVIKTRIWCFTGASTGKEQRRKERGRRKSGRCDHNITIYFASTIIKHLHTIHRHLLFFICLRWPRNISSPSPRFCWHTRGHCQTRPRSWRWIGQSEEHQQVTHWDNIYTWRYLATRPFVKYYRGGTSGEYSTGTAAIIG